ncbi:MAG: BON domain-containing protein [Terriglobia bacterium]
MKTQKNFSSPGALARSFLVLALMGLVTFAVGVQSANAKSRAPQDQVQYETWLNKQVQHRLATLPWYGVFDNLAYKVQGNQVVLYGEVVRPVTKSDAAGAVKGLEGVTRVVNHIKVLPLSPMDERIRLAEYRAIFSQPSLSRYAMGAIPSIHIIVDNGHVTLTGVVDNSTDKNLASMRAQGVPGVFSVTNHLQVA